MNSSSSILNRVRFSISLLLLSYLFICQVPQTVQSKSITQICGRFGHSCFGANWGKRTVQDELQQQDSLLNSNEDYNNLPMISDKKDPYSMTDYILEELRSELFRHRLRQLSNLD